MGQAKQRGSLEERIELASSGRDERIGALRETLGIPDAVKFGGYLVKVDDGDEFVSALGDQHPARQPARLSGAGSSLSRKTQGVMVERRPDGPAQPPYRPLCGGS